MSGTDPSVAEVAQAREDHGETALVGGRNVSHEYYTGFDEVALSPDSMWREVPWLDGGSRVEGPALDVLERAFRDAWREAGGASFEIVASPPAGSTPVRVVIHRGLRDAYTLEAYIALIETAQSHIEVVNGFPLILEIQHAQRDMPGTQNASHCHRVSPPEICSSGLWRPDRCGLQSKKTNE